MCAAVSTAPEQARWARAAPWSSTITPVTPDPSSTWRCVCVGGGERDSRNPHQKQPRSIATPDLNEPGLTAPSTADGGGFRGPIADPHTPQALCPRSRATPPCLPATRPGRGSRCTALRPLHGERRETAVGDCGGRQRRSDRHTHQLAPFAGSRSGQGDIIQPREAALPASPGRLALPRLHRCAGAWTGERSRLSRWPEREATGRCADPPAQAGQARREHAGPRPGLASKNIDRNLRNNALARLVVPS